MYAPTSGELEATVAGIDLRPGTDVDLLDDILTKVNDMTADRDSPEYGKITSSEIHGKCRI